MLNRFSKVIFIIFSCKDLSFLPLVVFMARALSTSLKLVDNNNANDADSDNVCFPDDACPNDPTRLA